MSIVLNYQSQGRGEPVLILHGLFGSAKNWGGIAKPLSEQYQVISVDLRNHGGSPHHPDMSFADMVADLRALIETLGFGAVHVIGHSLGGKVAMGLALSHVTLLKKLMVVDVAPVNYPPSFQGYIAAMQSAPLAAAQSRADIDRHLQPAVPHLATRQFLLHNLVRGGNGFAWRINLDAIAANLEAIASFPENWPHASYAGPVRFLAGETSRYIQPEHRPVMERLFPRATLHTIAGAGHWVHADQPQSVLEQIRGFLAE